MDHEDATPEASAENPRKGGLFYKLALAGVGGVMIAQEEIANFFRRPERADAPAAEAEEESSEEQPPLPPARPDRIDTTIDSVLHTFNVPSRADVDALARQVEALSARLDAFRSRG